MEARGRGFKHRGWGFEEKGWGFRDGGWGFDHRGWGFRYSSLPARPPVIQQAPITAVQQPGIYIYIYKLYIAI